MTIMSGLVGTGADHGVASRRSAAGEWVMRHAWGLILTGSLAFWLTLAALLLWG
jgi:hypothetical protein